MTEMEQKLQQMLDKVERKRYLDKLMEQLEPQREELRLRCCNFEIEMNKENRDVDTLENSSIAGFFLDMLGKREEKLEKERQEAYAAKSKYITARNELAQMDGDIDRYTRELAQLKNIESELQRLLDTYLAQQGTANDRVVLQTQLSLLRGKKLELEEAVNAGRDVARVADNVLNYLSKADSWSTADFFLDSFLVDVAKHDNLDKATAEINNLQACLRRFRSELADVTIERNISINIDGFVTFADYFWDGIFSNMEVQRKITDAARQVRTVRNKAMDAVSAMVLMMNDNSRQQQEIEQKLNMR